VAETTKLSVGQALEKLRGTDAPKAKMSRLDEKIDTLDEEIQRMRAMRRRLERDQRAAGSTGRDAHEANTRRVTKLKILGIIIGIVIVIPIWRGSGGFFSRSKPPDRISERDRRELPLGPNAAPEGREFSRTK
jgi:hypothetical protein